MEIGNYTNIFPVKLISQKAELMVAPRSLHPNLKKLREEIIPTLVYAPTGDDKIYGYGQEFEKLVKYGFTKEVIDLSDIPKLTCRLIIEGFSNWLSNEYEVTNRKFRYYAIDKNNPIETIVPEVKLYKGYEYRSIFFKSQITGSLVFGLIVDLRYRFTWDENPCSIWEIKYNCLKSHGYGESQRIVRDIRVKTGELTPSYKRNLEASKLRFSEILSFIQKIEVIELPTGNKVEVSHEPLKIMIESEEEEEYEFW